MLSRTKDIRIWVFNILEEFLVPTLNVEATFPLKFSSDSWSPLDLPLVNCEIELDLSWTKDCVLI